MNKSMIIRYDVEQGSDEWFELRRGIPTASGASKIVTPKTAKMSASADKYIAELIAETVDPEANTFAGNYWTERGHQLESEARAWYEFESGNTVTQTGIIIEGYINGFREFVPRCGVSPDGLIDDDGMLEIKCPKPATHVFYFMKDCVPPEYMPQVHAALAISKRKWLDFVSYCPGFEPLMIRVEPNEYTHTLWETLQEFIARLEQMKEIILREEL